VVQPEAEAEVRVGLAGEVEPRGLGEDVGVAVGRADEQQSEAPSVEGHAAHLEVLENRAPGQLHG
jgi:hypothetical protein